MFKKYLDCLCNELYGDTAWDDLDYWDKLFILGRRVSHAIFNCNKSSRNC